MKKESSKANFIFQRYALNLKRIIKKKKKRILSPHNIWLFRSICNVQYFLLKIFSHASLSNISFGFPPNLFVVHLTLFGLTSCEVFPEVSSSVFYYTFSLGDLIQSYSFKFHTFINNLFFNLLVWKQYENFNMKMTFIFLQIQLYWVITDKVVRYLQCTLWWFDIDCERTAPIKIINTFITSHIYLFPPFGENI